MGWPKHADSADKVHEWYSDKGRGVVKNLNSFADVINGSLLMGKIV